MEIWILVIVLLVIAIVLFIASYFSKDSTDIDRELSEFTVQQSEELYQLKNRIAQLEQQSYNDTTSVIESNTTQSFSTLTDEEMMPTEIEVDVIEINQIDDNLYEEIIRLYSQGYTMSEIGESVQQSVDIVQAVIDDYIENK